MLIDLFRGTPLMFHALQFIKTPRFLALRIKLDNEDDVAIDDYTLMQSNASTPSVPPGLGEEEVGGAYVTVSLRAVTQDRAHGGERPAS